MSISLIDYLMEDGSPRVLTNQDLPDQRKLLEKFGDLFMLDNEKNREEFIKQMIKRENLGSTGIGKGYAIPHIRSHNIDNTKIGIIITNGTDYNAVDRRLIYIAMGIVSPDSGRDYITILGNISNVIKGGCLDEIMERAKVDKTIRPIELLEAISAYEKSKGVYPTRIESLKRR